MKNILTKKIGDVPVMILVIGVVALVILAIFSFAFSLPKYTDDFKTISFIEEANSRINQYYFYRDKKIDIGESNIEVLLYLNRGTITPYSQNSLYVYVGGKINGKNVSVIYPLS